jgi:hypothetical protein
VLALVVVLALWAVKKIEDEDDDEHDYVWS